MQKKLYLYTFTWADGEVYTIESESSWEAQNWAHWNRYGQYATPIDQRVELVNMKIDPIELVYRTEVFDSEGTMAIIDPRKNGCDEQGDAVYVSRQRNLNSPERIPPFVLSDDEYQEILDRISWVVGLTRGEFTLLVNQ